MRKIRNLAALFVVLNVVGLLAFGWLCFQATIAGPLQAQGRYTSLDREQVINEQRLAEAFPDLAANSRYLVPKWMTQVVASAAQSLALWGAALIQLNIVVLLTICRLAADRTRRTQSLVAHAEQ